METSRSRQLSADTGLLAREKPLHPQAGVERRSPGPRTPQGASTTILPQYYLATTPPRHRATRPARPSKRLEQVVEVPLLTLMDAPDFTRLATGSPKSGLALPPGSGGSRGDARRHPFLSP